MTAEFGAHTQLEKIEMLDVADLVVLNKYEKRGSEDALRAIRKQVRRNRNMFDVEDEELPVVATIASQFADPGVDVLWQKLAGMVGFNASDPIGNIGERKGVIPPERVHYLSKLLLRFVNIMLLIPKCQKSYDWFSILKPQTELPSISKMSMSILNNFRKKLPKQERLLMVSENWQNNTLQENTLTMFVENHSLFQRLQNPCPIR